MFGKKFNTQEENIWITSDLHFDHGNILHFCPKTRNFKNTVSMNEALITEWNTKVKPEDYIIHLGDFCFKGVEVTSSFLQRLNGKKIMVLGNHDKALRNGIDEGKFGIVWKGDYLELQIDKQKVVLCHYPLTTWNNAGRGSLQMFGHCVDTTTEILTPYGWKCHNCIEEGDEVITYNPQSKLLEIDVVEEYHWLPEYDGVSYINDTQKFSFCGTDKHKLVGETVNGVYKEILVEDYVKRSTKLKFIRSGYLPSEGMDLSDNELLLYICLAADGNICNTNLGRFRFSKQRKIDYAIGILEKLGLSYTKNKTKDEMVNINFNIPDKIMELQIKGLDEKLMKCNKHQASLVLEAYENTDGYRPNNRNTVIIYTSKPEEKDLLQRFFVTKGYSCTVGVRPAGHGFSVKDNYELIVTKKSTQISESSNFKKVVDENKDFWCVTTKNGNFMCRRNGKVHITGNCHGSLPEPRGRQMDIGYDNLGEIKNIKEVMKILNKKEIYSSDQH